MDKEGTKGKSSKKLVDKQRHVKANNPVYNRQFKYANNYIKTSKYNIFSFLPINLFEQFKRLANFYFLCLLALQLIPSVSSLEWYTTVIPLLFVLLITAIKDAYDDIQRHRSDSKVNNRKVELVRNGTTVTEIWQQVEVGDIIRMKNGHFVAADLLLLSTSEPFGLCYVETAELDGETNLKAKQALPETAALCENLQNISEFDGEVICEPPNNRLATFLGQLHWKNKIYSLDNDKMLLRGCVIRNTKWCYGVVVFAGQDTKLMMNSGKTYFKRTSLDKFVNVLIIGIMFFLLAMCLICTILCGLWEWVYGDSFDLYIPRDTVFTNQTANVFYIALLVLFSYIILLNTVVPISLYVSVEVLRLFHSLWINWDTDMYCPVKNTAALSRTTTLNEELGQIEYVFSDKTGTLTQNVMTFNKCSINGIRYGDIEDDDDVFNGVSRTPLEPVNFKKYNPWAEESFKFYDSQLLEETLNRNRDVDRFWRLLALCHTVMPEQRGADELLYQAQSPDEAALVSAARNFGYVFKSRTPDTITIEVNGVEETYDLLCILDFNNVRKRMSVLVRRNGRIILYCKGADTVITERLMAQDTSVTHVHLTDFANEGLRTLCLAYKAVTEHFYEQWAVRQHEASIANENRQELLDAVYEEIEKDMVQIGVTAVEDKLQEGVPETIEKLIEANIKVWVLTGDKQETAINIGYACRLLTEDTQEFIVDKRSLQEVRDELVNIEKYISDNPIRQSPVENGDIHMADLYNGSVPPENRPHQPDFNALVINGESLAYALDKNLEDLFLSVISQCQTVICCRVTPLQKALVVDLIKRNEKAVTLAVGDGANDVSMIKTAHIGVGINGVEGAQAVLASDFSIAQFRFLEKLILVHGRWSYYRMSIFLRYFFYKNFAFTLVHFWYAFYCGYSAQTIYDSLFISSYNLICTSLPVMAAGILDQDVNEDNSHRFPKLYTPGPRNSYFNMRIFGISLLHGIYTSLVMFFAVLWAARDTTNHRGMPLDDLGTFSYIVSSAMVVSVSGQIAIDTGYWTFLNFLALVISGGGYFGLFVLYYAWKPFNTFFAQVGFGYGYEAMKTPTYWLTILLIAASTLLPLIAFRFFFFLTQPTLQQRVRIKQSRECGRRTIQNALSPLRAISHIRSHSSKSKRSSRTPTVRKRSGYSFSHEAGFGDLITRGKMRMRSRTISIGKQSHNYEDYSSPVWTTRVSKLSSVDENSPVEHL